MSTCTPCTSCTAIPENKSYSLTKIYEPLRILKKSTIKKWVKKHMESISALLPEYLCFYK